MHIVRIMELVFAFYPRMEKKRAFQLFPILRYPVRFLHLEE